VVDLCQREEFLVDFKNNPPSVDEFNECAALPCGFILLPDEELQKVFQQMNQSNPKAIGQQAKSTTL